MLRRMTFSFGHDSLTPSWPSPGCNQYLVALGSNLGDRMAHLRAAIKAVNSELGPVVKIAPFYETAPIGAADQAFLNSAMVVTTSVGPQEALDVLLSIERSLGRVRDMRWGNRTCDLDILLWRRLDARGQWESLSWQSPSLKIPHPEMLKRDFVMIPAAAVAGDWVLPGTELMLASLSNQSDFCLSAPVANCFEASLE